MPGLAIAGGVTPDNTPGGSVLTFAIPIALFALVAVALYLLFSRSHRRVPARQPVRLPGGTRSPDPDAAHAASIAGGLSLAAGGGTLETPLEPHAAPPVAAAAADQEQESAPAPEVGRPPDESAADGPDHESATADDPEPRQ